MGTKQTNHRNKTRAISMQNVIKTKRLKTKNSKKTPMKNGKNERAKTLKVNDSRNRSKSQGVNKRKTRHSENSQERECSLYKHERIHFSKMELLELADNAISTDSDLADDESPDSKQRKMAFAKNVLSTKQYQRKKNIIIGAIKVGHKYKLKNGEYGICCYVGPVHWKNNQHSLENEYIGMAMMNNKVYKGGHDGECRGKRYFHCQPGRGLFVKRNKLYKDCGPVDKSLIEEITKKNENKIGGFLYENDSDISELSENDILDTNHLKAMLSDNQPSGHSDFDNLSDEEEVKSFIDLNLNSLDTSIQNDDIVIVPKQHNENDKVSK